MRIVLITAHYQPAVVACGVGDYTRCVRRALDDLGHPCQVLTSERSRSTEAGVHRIAGRWDARDAAGAWQILRALAPDVVVLQYTPEHYGFGAAFKLLPALLRAGRRGPLVVTTFHTLVGGRWIAKPYAALLAATSHGVISTHAELTDLFRRRLTRWAGKLREIPIGANVPAPAVPSDMARRRLRQRLGLPTDATVLATFGFPAPGKGFDTLLEALALLDAPPGIHLALLGETREEDRPYRARLEALARERGIVARIHWTGPLPEQEVTDLLAGSDAYVVPYDEGSSLRRGTLMAGIRAGVPIVTTTPRYSDAALVPGETILAVPTRAPEALAAGIGRLLADPALQARLRAGMAGAAARFEWSAIAAQHVAFATELRRAA